MKIAIITNGTIPLPSLEGGIETLVTSFLQKEKNNEIFVYSSAKENNNQQHFSFSENIHFKYVDFKKNVLLTKINSLLFSFSKRLKTKKILQFHSPYNKKIARDINKNNFDIVLSENNFRIVPLIKNTPVIYHSHYDDINVDKEKAWTVLMRQYLSKVHIFVGVSDYISKRIRSVFPSIDCLTIKNIPHESFVSNPKKDKTIICKELGLEPDLKYVLYVGRFDKEKGVDILINAFNNVKKNLERVRLILIGKENDSPFWQNLKRNISSDIIITGFVDNDVVYKYYDISEIVVIPSFRVNESSSLVSIEAITRGCKIVYSDTGGIRENASLSKNSFPCNGLEWQRLLEDQLMHAHNTKTKIESINLDIFSVEHYVEQFDDLFNSIKRNKV